MKRLQDPSSPRKQHSQGYSFSKTAGKRPTTTTKLEGCFRKVKNFFKIVVDIVKYGWYYTEVASREAQQKSLRNAGSKGKMNLENRRSDSTDNPEIS